MDKVIMNQDRIKPMLDFLIELEELFNKHKEITLEVATSCDGEVYIGVEYKDSSVDITIEDYKISLTLGNLEGLKEAIEELKAIRIVS